MTTTTTPDARRIETSAAARTFMFGGKARFTLVSKRTGKRYTYRVAKAKDGDLWFASVLIGQSNEDDYAYIGFIKGDELVAGRKGNAEHPAFKGLAWLMRTLVKDPAVPADVEFWHEGRCCRCGRTLTVPASIESGIGPECATKL
jgi:hypothetical protein